MDSAVQGRLGFYWADDGDMRMAAAFPSRIKRFFRGGIRNRCEFLTNRYLQGKVPIGPGKLAVNVGANIGEVAVVLADSGMQVLAFEADPAVLPALYANAEGRDMFVIPAAAWHEDGKREMFHKPDSADSGFFTQFDDKIVVQTRRLDTTLENAELVHLIVGDVEGAEPEALEGATETLKRTSYVSLCCSAERNGERTLETCEAILKGAGFDIIHREDKKFCTLIGYNDRAC